MALGYRSLALAVVNDFVFSSVPDDLASLADETFQDPFTLGTSKQVTWAVWLQRNYPTLFSLFMMLPSQLLSKLTTAFDGMIELDKVGFLGRQSSPGRLNTNAN